jgi:hypothetical protein
MASAFPGPITPRHNNTGNASLFGTHPFFFSSNTSGPAAALSPAIPDNKPAISRRRITL